MRSTPEVNQAESHEQGETSLRTLFEGEESKLLRYAYSLTGRRAVAEEIVQEVFLQLHAQWATVQNPQAWLVRSVRNRAFNHLRKTKRELLQGEENVTEAIESDAQKPDDVMARMETHAAIRRLLTELSETDRELVKLKYFEGLKYREIAARLELSISNVGFRLHQILKRLASELRPLGIDGDQ